MSLVHMKTNTNVPKGPPPPPQPKTEHNWPRMFKQVHDQLMFERRLFRWNNAGMMRVWIFTQFMAALGGYLISSGLKFDPVLWSYVAYVIIALAMLSLINICVFSLWGAKWHKLREKPSS